MASEQWWATEPGIVPCPRCECPIQRPSTGTLLDGLRAHFSYVHPGQAAPSQLPASRTDS